MTFCSVLKTSALALLALAGTRNWPASAQTSAPGNANPLLPGYFADPFVFNDNGTFYIFATTDGYDTGAFTTGPFGGWRSTDFVNWSFKTFDYPANFPNQSSKHWAPAVTKGPDGRYYNYYVKDGYNCFVASAASPLGPWQAENNGQPVYPDMFDTDVFRDTDGSYYLIYQGPKVNNSYGIYLGKLRANMLAFDGPPQLIYQNNDLFEGPSIFKRQGKYYLTYSNGSLSGTYHVNAAYGGTAIFGPYAPRNGGGAENPLLESDSAHQMVATGHNSVLQLGADYYIVYHRKAYPYNSSSLFRQVCAERLVFAADGTLPKIYPTFTSVGALGPLSNPKTDLAFGKSAVASSSAGASYAAGYAFDRNNATLWKAAAPTYPQTLQVDLGALASVTGTEIFFEYPTESYQYKIDSSPDGSTWRSYVVRTSSTARTAPLTDTRSVKARYLKLTITGSTKTNQSPGVWAFKVHGENSAKRKEIKAQGSGAE